MHSALFGTFTGTLPRKKRSGILRFSTRKKAYPPGLGTRTLLLVTPIKLPRLLVDLDLSKSTSEAQRKIKEGAVYMAIGFSDKPNWQRLNDPAWEFDVMRYDKQQIFTFRVGWRLQPVKFDIVSK